jgi:molybdate transport system ATP-binding protein
VRDNLLYGERLALADRRFMTLQEAQRLSGYRPSARSLAAHASGGEAQRVAIGRALLSGPRFLLLDEPLASLDAERRDEIMQVIERLRDELRLPILYVSHDRTEIDRLAGNVVRL